MPNGTAADSTGLAAHDHPLENQPSRPVDACLTPVETAAKLGISTRTLENWRRTGNGPPFLRLSKVCVRYPAPGLQQYMKARTFTSTSAEAMVEG